MYFSARSVNCLFSLVSLFSCKLGFILFLTVNMMLRIIASFFALLCRYCKSFLNVSSMLVTNSFSCLFNRMLYGSSLFNWSSVSSLSSCLYCLLIFVLYLVDLFSPGMYGDSYFCSIFSAHMFTSVFVVCILICVIFAFWECLGYGCNLSSLKRLISVSLSTRTRFPIRRIAPYSAAIFRVESRPRPKIVDISAIFTKIA